MEEILERVRLAATIVRFEVWAIAGAKVKPAEKGLRTIKKWRGLRYPWPAGLVLVSMTVSEARWDGIAKTNQGVVTKRDAHVRLRSCRRDKMLRLTLPGLRVANIDLKPFTTL